MVHVVQSLPLIPGIGGSLLICTVSTGGFLIPLRCLNGFLEQVVDNRRNGEGSQVDRLASGRFGF